LVCVRQANEGLQRGGERSTKGWEGYHRIRTGRDEPEPKTSIRAGLNVSMELGGISKTTREVA